MPLLFPLTEGHCGHKLPRCTTTIGVCGTRALFFSFSGVGELESLPCAIGKPLGEFRTKAGGARGGLSLADTPQATATRAAVPYRACRGEGDD